MLSERDLKLMRSTQLEAMPDLFTITRRVLTDDGFGGVEELGPRVVVAAAVPGRVVPGLTVEGLGQLGRPVEVKRYTVRVPLGTDIRDEDFIMRESDGLTLQIDDVKVPRTWDTAISCDAEVIQ